MSRNSDIGGWSGGHGKAVQTCREGDGLGEVQGGDCISAVAPDYFSAQAFYRPLRRLGRRLVTTHRYQREPAETGQKQPLSILGVLGDAGHKSRNLAAFNKIYQAQITWI